MMLLSTDRAKVLELLSKIKTIENCIANIEQAGYTGELFVYNAGSVSIPTDEAVALLKSQRSATIDKLKEFGIEAL